MNSRAAPVSNNEKAFIVEAIKRDLRASGRKPYDYRSISIQFSLDDSNATVELGDTRVLASVSAEIAEPFPDRPSEGSIQFRVEFSPMASREFEPGRPGEAAVEVSRIIERSLRETRALDTESLVILSGLKVWHVKCDVHVLDHDGNLMDACALAALAALTVFRRPDVTIGGATGKEITVHPKEVREPVSLTIHHIPLAVTIAFFEDGAYVAVDPDRKEEAAMTGQITCVLNKQQELCSIQKAGGVSIPVAMVEHCISVSSQKILELTEILDNALSAHRTSRERARIRRHVPGVVSGPGSVPTKGKGSWRLQAMANKTLELSQQMLDADSGSSSEEEPCGDRNDPDMNACSLNEEENARHIRSQNDLTSLPPGSLLKPGVLKSAGLISTEAKVAKKRSHTHKKSSKADRSTLESGTPGDDDFADIAAVIANAAAKGGAGGNLHEGLQSTIKKTKHKVVSSK